MKRNHNVPNTELSSKLPKRQLAAAAAAAILVTGGGAANTWAASREGGSRHSATGASGAPPAPHGQGLPPNWPITRGLPPKECRFGDPIDRQVPQKIDSHLAAVIDSRCEPPRNQPFTNAHIEPNRNSVIIGRVFDGQTVKLHCRITGEALGDERSADFKNPDWFIITFPDMDQHNKPLHGYVAGANMGQLAVDSELPSCAPMTPGPVPTEAPSSPNTSVPTPLPSATARVPIPTTTQSPTSVPVPTTTFTRSPVPTTTQSRTFVPVPTTTPSPTTIFPPPPTDCKHTCN